MSPALTEAATTWVALVIFVGTAAGLLAKEVVRERVQDQVAARRWLRTLNWLVYPLLVLCLELALLRILVLT